MTPGDRQPSPHRPRHAAAARQQAVLGVLDQPSAGPLTLDEIYQALSYKQTRAEVKSALSCLRVQKRVEIVVRGRVGVAASTYRAAGAGRRVG